MCIEYVGVDIHKLSCGAFEKAYPVLPCLGMNTHVEHPGFPSCGNDALDMGTQVGRPTFEPSALLRTVRSSDAYAIDYLLPCYNVRVPVVSLYNASLLAMPVPWRGLHLSLVIVDCRSIVRCCWLVSEFPSLTYIWLFRPVKSSAYVPVGTRELASRLKYLAWYTTKWKIGRAVLFVCTCACDGHILFPLLSTLLNTGVRCSCVR